MTQKSKSEYQADKDKGLVLELKSLMNNCCQECTCPTSGCENTCSILANLVAEYIRDEGWVRLKDVEIDDWALFLFLRDMNPPVENCSKKLLADKISQAKDILKVKESEGK